MAQTARLLFQFLCFPLEPPIGRRGAVHRMGHGLTQTIGTVPECAKRRRKAREGTRALAARGALKMRLWGVDRVRTAFRGSSIAGFALGEGRRCFPRWHFLIEGPVHRSPRGHHVMEVCVAWCEQWPSGLGARADAPTAEWEYICGHEALGGSSVACLHMFGMRHRGPQGTGDALSGNGTLHSAGDQTYFYVVILLDKG